MGGGCEKTAGGQVTIPIWLSWTSLVGASLKLLRPEIRSLHQKRAVMIEVGRVEIREGDEAVEIVEGHTALLEGDHPCSRRVRRTRLTCTALSPSASAI